MHPGEFIRRVYLEPFNLTVEEVAKKLPMSSSNFGTLINGQSDVNSVIALKLSKAFGRSPESWLIMQKNRNNHMDNLEPNHE